MARRSLALLSEGMVSGSTKKAITIASIGWLVITGGPIPPTPGGGSGDGAAAIGAANIGRRVEDGELGRKELLERLMRDEKDWMAFLEVFTKHIL